MRQKPRPHEPIWDCFKYAFIGILQAFRTERNLRVHFVMALLAALAGLVLGLDAVELAILTLTIVFVLALELVNAAFEATIDLVSPDQHPLAGYVKDVGAGAVLVASAGALIVAALLLLPRIIHLITG